MHIQFMIEDSSSAALIEVLMGKLKDSVSLLTYDVKHFHGIGGFTRKNTVKEIKTGKLLNDLATYCFLSGNWFAQERMGGEDRRVYGLRCK